MSIDEAIARERELAERNLILLDYDELVQKSYDTYLRAEYHEQIVMWLEELKVLKENSISKEAFEQMKSKSHRHGYRQGYSKAIDDFVKFANTMPTVETEDGTIRPMWLEEMAERLKGQNK